MNERKKKVLLALLVVIALVGGVVMAKGYPDWATNVIQHEGTTFVVTGDVDANITNSALDVNVTNSQLDVNVTNSTLDVNVAGTADVEIQNANVNVKNLRERVVEPGDLSAFAKETGVAEQSTNTVRIWTNPFNRTVYLEYFSVAVEVGVASQPCDTLSPLAVAIRMSVKTSGGTELFRLTSNGQMFLNLDPALPIPEGGYIEVYMSNASDKSLFVNIAGIVRVIS